MASFLRPSVRASRALAPAALLAACAHGRRPEPLLPGGDTPCAGTRLLDVHNPWNGEVLVWVRAANGQLTPLSPVLRAGEERRFELPGRLALKEVFGRAKRETMRSTPGTRGARIQARDDEMKVELRPALSCRRPLG